jgi:hypothetical protein
MKCWYKFRTKIARGFFQAWSLYTDSDGSCIVAIIIDELTKQTVEVAAENVAFSKLPPWLTTFEVRKVYLCKDINGTLYTALNEAPADEIIASNILVEGYFDHE